MYIANLRVGMSLQEFDKMTLVHDLTGEEIAVLMYRFGIVDGIVRTIPEVMNIMNQEHIYAECERYTLDDILSIERHAILSIEGPKKGA